VIDIRGNCEHCDKDLPVDSTEAMFCAHECTFCFTCVTEVLENVCPNCGGGFEKRPVLISTYHDRLETPLKRVFKPVDMDAFIPLKEKLKDIPPSQR